jgi:hypothetical protein
LLCKRNKRLEEEEENTGNKCGVEFRALKIEMECYYESQN